MIRLIRALAAVAITVAAGVPLSAGVAAAAPLDLECAGTVTVTYSPGLTLTPTNQTITTNEIDAPCTSASRPDITSGHTGVTVHETRSCLSLADPGSGIKPFTWNTGETSLFSFNRTVSHPGGDTVVTLTGAITGGPFAGSTAIEVITFPNPNLLGCLVPPGVTNLFGVATLTIT